MTRLPRSTTALIGLNLILGVVLLWCALSGRSLDERLQAVDRPQSAAAPRKAAVQIPQPGYEALRETAVFHSSRKFFKPLVPQAPPAPQPQYQFVAAMVLPDRNRSIAYLRKADGAPSVKVRHGDVLEGWTVHRIEPRRVVLTFDAQELEIAAAQPARGSMNQLTTASPSGGLRPGAGALRSRYPQNGQPIPGELRPQARYPHIRPPGSGVDPEDPRRETKQ